MVVVGSSDIVPATTQQGGLGSQSTESSSCGSQFDTVSVVRTSDRTELFQAKECAPL